jgi:hypothetical protein
VGGGVGGEGWGGAAKAGRPRHPDPPELQGMKRFFCSFCVSKIFCEMD